MQIGQSRSQQTQLCNNAMEINDKKNQNRQLKIVHTYDDKNKERRVFTQERKNQYQMQNEST